MPMRHGRRPLAAVALLCGLLTPWGAPVAQDAAYFSPTYAASQGSPYSEIYARTFGGRPLETAAPGAAEDGAAAVVYVIEGGRLLTYSADDYARGRDDALAGSALTPAAPDGRLYGAVPPAPATGEEPIPLLPQRRAR